MPSTEQTESDDVTYFTRYSHQMTDFNQESESWRMYILYNDSRLGHIPEIYGTEAFQNYHSAESLYSERTGTELPMVMSPKWSQCTATADPDRRLEKVLTIGLTQMYISHCSRWNVYGGRYLFTSLVSLVW